MRKNVSGQVIGAQLINRSDGTAVTTGSTEVYITGDGGTQAIGSVGSGLCTHEGNGYWTYTPSVTETNYDEIAFTFVNSIAVPATIQVYTTVTSGATTTSTTPVIGSTFDANLTRDDLINMAYRDIGVLADGEVLSASLHAHGLKKLNSLIREIDASGKWLWTETSSTITLVANQWVYTVSSGLPSDLREPDRVLYRDALGQDWPVELLSSESYAAINNKTQQGDPSKVRITVSRAIGSQTLYLWPALGTVNTQSVVTGTNAAAYKCIRSHTADSTNKPITGANYLLYWEAGGTSPATWATNTSYTAPQLLILYYRRPLYDFDAATDNPDMPSQWTRLLEYRLASDLADMHGVGLEERALLNAKAKGSYDDIFKSLRPQTQDYHNKASYI
jgi:hypothetical protein